MRLLSVALGLCGLLLLNSCGSKLIYFKQGKHSLSNYDTVKVTKSIPVSEHIIEAGDVLQIRLYNPDASLISLFNNNTLGDNQSIKGYQVQNNGYIFIPFAGSVMLKGLMISEAQNVVRDSLKRYVKDPIVALDLVAFRVIVLGQVYRPGPVLVPTDKASIIDLLALSGDLNDRGSPRNIKLVRDTDSNKMIHFYDLNDIDIFQDPYYFVKSNDIVYVETLQRQFLRDNIAYLSLVSTMIATLSIVAIRFRQL